jgi:hypothetical protein
VNCQTVEIEEWAHVVRTDGLHGQVVSTDRERGTFRVGWENQTASTHFRGGAALASRLLGVDMEEAR